MKQLETFNTTNLVLYPQTITNGVATIQINNCAKNV